VNPIQEYYNLERNAEIKSFWDEGFQIQFGDRINGYEESIYVFMLRHGKGLKKHSRKK
jgi:hypothetical protein